MSTDDTGDDGASVSRRDFVKAAGSIGAIAGLSSVTVNTDLGDLWTDDEHHYVGDEYGEYDASDVIHTTCGQCNTFCPVKVRLADQSGTGEYSSLIRKLAGNPYSFLTTQPFGQVPYDSDPEDVAMGDLEGTGDVDGDRWSLSGGRICLKGQAGIQTAFDSYRDVSWGGLDYLIVDLPPGTGDVQMTVLQNLPVTGAVIVTTPQSVAVDDTRRGVEMFAEYGTNVLGVVENMSGFVCPDCGGHHDVFGDDGGRSLAEAVDVPYLGSLPLDPTVRAGGDDGEPIVRRESNDTATAFETLAETVANKIGALRRHHRQQTTTSG